MVIAAVKHFPEVLNRYEQLLFLVWSVDWTNTNLAVVIVTLKLILLQASKVTTRHMKKDNSGGGACLCPAAKVK